MSSNTLLTFEQKLNDLARVKFDEGKDIRFYINRTWGGEVDSISPNLLPDWAATSVLNAVGYGTYLEKFIGSKILGYHSDANVKEMRGLRIFDFFDPLGHYTIVKVVEYEGQNRIYKLEDLDGDLEFTGTERQWLNITPPQGIGTGRTYNFARWRNQLFMVSGNQFNYGTQEGGVFRYDPSLVNSEWQVIDTGFGVTNLPTSTGADGPERFYPETIAFQDDVMYLGGNKQFPAQVKFAQHSNPYNVVGNLEYPFLGLLDVPPTIQDLLRPSTFVLNQNGDRITALLVANGYLWVVTNRRFYAFKNLNVLNTQLPAGLLWLDILKEHKARTGAYSQKSIVQNDQFFDFISTNRIRPTLSTISPVISQDRIDNVYNTRSSFIEKTMKSIDWTDSAVGVYGVGQQESIELLSGSRCGDRPNDVTLTYRQVDDLPFFSRLDYINAQDWLSNDYSTFWLSSDTGDVYELTPDSYNIQDVNVVSDKNGGEIKNLNPRNYPFVWQSGKFGVATNDVEFSEKKLGYLYIVGCCGRDTKVTIDIYKQANLDLKDWEETPEEMLNKEELQAKAELQEGKEPADTTCCVIQNLTRWFVPNIDCSDFEACSCEDDVKTPFVHQGGTLFMKLIPYEEDNLIYNVLNLRIKAETSGYFALHQVGCLYTQLKNPDGNLLAKTKLVGLQEEACDF